VSKRLKGNTILIIEDDADIRKFTRRVLELEGYHVLLAETANEGLRLVRGNSVSLVLLDLRLTGDSGWLVLKQIKKETAISAIPVIIFTACAQVLEREKALALGASDYLTKPLSAINLKDTVTRVLKSKR
jgi:DNA-binding response OmpR family regulator